MKGEQRSMGDGLSESEERELRKGWEVFSAMTLARMELKAQLDGVEKLRAERDRLIDVCDAASDRTADSVQEMRQLLERMMAEDEAAEAAAAAAGASEPEKAVEAEPGVDDAGGEGAAGVPQARSLTEREMRAESWAATLTADELTDGISRLKVVVEALRKSRRWVVRARKRYGQALTAYAAFLKEGAAEDGELATRLAVGDALDELEQATRSAARRGRGEA